MARKPVMEDTEDILGQDVQENIKAEVEEPQEEAKPAKPVKASMDPW